MAVFDFFSDSALPRPSIAVDEALRIAHERYGIVGELTELGSNQDRNFLIDDGARRVLLKFSNRVYGPDELRAQNLAAEAVLGAGLRAPRCIPSRAGNDLETVVLPEGALQVRLLEFVAGAPLTGRGPFSADEARGLGELAAQVALSLAPIEHPGAAQRTQWNLRVGGDVVDLLADHVPDPILRARVRRVADGALTTLAPLRDALRTQVIHGDLTDDNIVDDHGDVGVIDFGDVAESWTVAELAVTCAAILHHNPREPLVVLEAIAAFHHRLPLTEVEVDALWPLVQLRAAVLVVSGEYQVSLESDNGYADGNRGPERRSFAVAADLDLATMGTLIRWRLGDRSAPCTVATPDTLLVDAATATTLDLSTTAAGLDDGAWFEADIEERLASAAGSSATVWGEARLSRAMVRSPRGVATVPLGIELTVTSETRVFAPVAGVLRHVDDAVVLEGEAYDLLLTGLDTIAADGPIDAGTALGTLAPQPQSLWVQVSRARGEVPPRFVPPAQAEAWKRVCPDPSALVGRAPSSAPISADAVLAERDASVARVQEHYYDDPPRIERGWREHFADTDAQTYVDMVNNVATVGHGHPRLVDAVSRQWALLNTNSRFHYAAIADFSRRLADLAPDPLDTVFLVNSGSEAVDLALRLATAVTGRPTIVAMREAYHGWTVGSDAVSTSIGDNPRALETRPDWVRLVDAPNTYRGTHRGPDAGARYLSDLADTFAGWDAEGVGIAGFIAEPVYGNAGGVMLPDGYLAGAYELVRDRGGLCIADEVQVGYGRLGSYFWGHEQQGVVPDIITVAKAMGNGHPLGAVITTRAIADAFAVEGSMFSSAGGSPVSCVVGMTVLDIMRDEGLVENARVVGAHLKARLVELGTRHPLIGAVHGLGLYLGVELVRSPVTLEPATTEATAICAALLAEGCIVQPTGDHKNVLKIKPPMVITRESVDYVVDALDRVLAGFHRRGR